MNNQIDSKRSYCRFCLSFCGILVEFDATGLPQKIHPDALHPVSRGYTCRKGRSLLEFYGNGRLMKPICNGEETDWEHVLSDLGQTIKKVVQKFGPDAVALYAGTNATLDATGMWAALGFMYRLKSKAVYTVASVDAINKQVAIENITSNSAPWLIPQIDFDHTDCLLLVGSNPVISHGHLAGIPYPSKQLWDLKKRGATLIVADPRVTKTAKRAAVHLRPLPGSDYAWLGFVIRELLTDPNGSGVDHEYVRKHTSKFAQLKSAVACFDLSKTQDTTGLHADQLDELVKKIKMSVRFSAVTGTGVSFADTGIVTEWFLWALLAIKGSLDRKGGVWFNPGVAKKDLVEKTVTTPKIEIKAPARTNLPSQREGLPISGMAELILGEKIKVLICLGGNPINAFPNSKRTLIALKNLQALVVLDTHKNELVEIAKYSLPVCGQLERADSSIYAQNSAPVISLLYTERILKPVGESRAAWWVFSKLGENLGLDVVKLGQRTEFLTDLDVLKTIKGGQYFFEETRLLDDGYYLAQEEKTFGWVRETVLPNKSWQLVTPTLSSELKRILGALPVKGMSLISMREDGHLNTQFIDENIGQLPAAHINTMDAVAYDLINDQIIQISSEFGSIYAKVFISNEIMLNTVGLPHGYSALGNISNLTSEIHGINPLSGMVKQTAISITIKKIND